MTISIPPCEIIAADILPCLHESQLYLDHNPTCDALNAASPLRVNTDSRAAGRASVFIAYKGLKHDTHNDIANVFSTGAVIAVVDNTAVFQSLRTKHPVILVKDSRRAWSWLSAKAFNHPQRDLVIAGVTGTNGKTSTVWNVKELLASVGKSAASIGTLGAWLGDEHVETTHTTPDPPELFGLLHVAKSQGIKFVAMEVSSQALVHGRMDPIRFSAAAFSSFTRDHLDFHGSMENYFAAKLRLFQEHCRPDARLVFSDTLDLAAMPRKTFSSQDLWLYGTNAQTAPNFHTARLSIEAASVRGSTLKIKSGDSDRQGTCAAAGGYAALNFAAAILLAEHMLKQEIPASLWSSVRPVPGRFETVIGTKPNSPAVVVDYAHTPDALEKVLVLARSLTKGRVLVVFGCGGDRDRGKRPLMAQAAAAGADIVFVTSDNPRTESPEAIIKEIVSGFRPQTHFHIDVDRRSAINAAISAGGPEDTVVIAGKGHEAYQIVGSKTLPFDDRLVASEILNK